MKFDHEAAGAALREMAPAYADRIAPVYKALDWRWGGQGDDQGKVPSRDEILETLNRLIDHIATDEDCVCTRTGGFEIGVCEEAGHPYICFTDDVTNYDVETIALEDREYEGEVLD